MSYYYNSTKRSFIQVDIMVSIIEIGDCGFLQRILRIKESKIVETETKIKNF